MSCGLAGFWLLSLRWGSCCIKTTPKLRVCKVWFCNHLFFILASFRGRFHDSLKKKNTLPVQSVWCNVFLLWPVLRVTCACHTCRLEAAIYILMETVPEFIAPVFYVSKSFFLLEDGDDVWALWNSIDMQIHEKRLFLIMCINRCSCIIQNCK